MEATRLTDPEAQVIPSMKLSFDIFNFKKIKALLHLIRLSQLICFNSME